MKPDWHPAGRLVVLWILTLLAGCAGREVDLAGPEGLGTDYLQGAVYELVQDRYLDTPQGLSGAPLLIIATHHSYPYGIAPASMDAYRADPGRWPKILGILPAGTRVRLDRIERHRYPGLEDWYEAVGTLQDGPFAGRKVNLGFISASVGDSRMLRVNPAELRRVAPLP